MLLWCAALGLSSCMTTPAARERSHLDNGAIMMAVSFKGREFPYWRRHRAEELFFAEIQPGGAFAERFTPANFRAGDRLYVLDIPPGRYALVGITYFTGRARQIARFPEKLAKEWAVEVKPGQLAFGGVAEIPRVMDGWDVFFMNGLRRAAQYLPPFKRALIPMKFDQQRLRLDRTQNAEVEALRYARFDLSGTQWTEAVADRMARLGSPPPPIMEGTFRKKAVKPRQADSFYWMDTLGWGEPVPVAGGLEWRRPKSSAVVSVTYHPKQGKNARDLETELAAVRQAGVGAEDTHTLAEVRVSSRSALAATYTAYVYPQASLLGSERKVVKTQALFVPVDDGFYRLQLRGEQADFEKQQPAFERFIRYLHLAKPKVPK